MGLKRLSTLSWPGFANHVIQARIASPNTLSIEEQLVGAKTWMLVYANAKVEDALKGAPQLDRDRTLKLATKLFPKDKLELIGDGDLSYTCPPDDELHIACFPGFLFWRQKNLELTIRQGCRTHS